MYLVINCECSCRCSCSRAARTEPAASATCRTNSSASPATDFSRLRLSTGAETLSEWNESDSLRARSVPPPLERTPLRSCSRTPLAAHTDCSQLTHSAVLHSLLIAHFLCFANYWEIQFTSLSASVFPFCIISHNHVVKLSLSSEFWQVLKLGKI